MSDGAAFRYTVEGERLTRRQIVDRVLALAPTLLPDTIRYRIDAGARTWAALSADPAKGHRNTYEVSKGRFRRMFGVHSRPRR